MDAPQPAFVWTDELLERAKRMWIAGDSGKGIAKAIGAPSRSAVIGKMHRLGVHRAEIVSVLNHRQAGKKTGGGASARAGLTIGNFAQKDGKPKPPTLSAIRAVEQARGPTPLMIPITQLGEHACRWPIGTPGEAGGGFCGNHTDAGRPYCGFHCAKAYQAPDPRRGAEALMQSLRRYA